MSDLNLSSLPLSDRSMKGFIEKNFQSELEQAFLAEKQRGYQEGIHEGQRRLADREREITEKEAELRQQMEQFALREQALSKKEAMLARNASQLTEMMRSLEAEFQRQREDNRADIIYVLSSVFQKVYHTEQMQHLLMELISAEMAKLPKPVVHLEISTEIDALIRKQETDIPGGCQWIVDPALSAFEARIVTEAMSVKVSPNRIRQVFKSNLMDLIDEIE
ncbi:hypothetical protein L4174_006435 [Photobacterium sp. CCB-ST2H9]|uniref:hypothetical protein n=1 Tax=Photobacterium sp. CCB-ST2H9 TaxID=2912855 RepID=UPI002003E567|nr:hypothetical protein [Photobacterium sp. CCB-ST2H9]UTM58473.1 hypothetical protein L4174_006435 [Photobacterium sp. CCB-ST2H9]